LPKGGGGEGRGGKKREGKRSTPSESKMGTQGSKGSTQGKKKKQT